MKFERSKGEWAGSLAMLVLSIPLFLFFYPWGGFNLGNKGLIYIVCAALALFLLGFYKTFLTPYALEFQEGGLLLIKSILYPKTVALDDVESVRITDTVSKNGSVRTAYALNLKSGDYYDVPSLSHMAGFLEKLRMFCPKIEIKDARTRKDHF